MHYHGHPSSPRFVRMSALIVSLALLALGWPAHLARADWNEGFVPGDRDTQKWVYSLQYQLSGLSYSDFVERSLEPRFIRDFSQSVYLRNEIELREGRVTGAPVRVRGAVATGPNGGSVYVGLSGRTLEERRFSLAPHSGASFDLGVEPPPDGSPVQLEIRLEAYVESYRVTATLHGEFAQAAGIRPEVTSTATPAVTPTPSAAGVSVRAIPGYEIPWDVSERVALRLIFATTHPEDWRIQKICDLADAPGFATYRLPGVGSCTEAGGQPTATLDIAELLLSQVPEITAPRSVPMRARALLRSKEGVEADVLVDFMVELRAAYQLIVKRQGVGGDHSESLVSLDGGMLSTGQSYLGFFGQSLEVPLEAIVAVRFVDGSAGFIVAPATMDILYEEAVLAMSADDAGFKHVRGASIGALVQDIGGEMVDDAIQDAVLNVLARRLSGPLGAALEVSGAVPAGHGAYRILAR